MSLKFLPHRCVSAAALTLAVVLAAGAVLAAMLPGCALVGATTYAIAGPTKTVTVPAEYTGLEGKSVAVMIAGDEYLLYRYPKAQILLATNIAARIVENIDGVRMVNPQPITKFQKENPEWMTLPYGELIQRVQVDRIVLVDLGDYRLHDPGNRELWRAVIEGNIGVVEADSRDPDNYAYYKGVRATFPEDGGVGVLESDQETVELAVTTLFAQKVAKLFYTHDEEVKR